MFYISFILIFGFGWFFVSILQFKLLYLSPNYQIREAVEEVDEKKKKKEANRERSIASAELYGIFVPIRRNF